mgnify:CR=1 FL=1
MRTPSCSGPAKAGRTPHGVRGLKYGGEQRQRVGVGRTPHGVRGLKCYYNGDAHNLNGVAPLTGCVD